VSVIEPLGGATRDPAQSEDQAQDQLTGRTIANLFTDGVYAKEHCQALRRRSRDRNAPRGRQAASGALQRAQMAPMRNFAQGNAAGPCKRVRIPVDEEACPMRIVVLSGAALMLMLAGEGPVSAADSSGSPAKDQKTPARAASAKDQKKDASAQRPGSGKEGEYYERDSNTLPVGSSRWFEQMEREGRFQRRN